MPTTIQLKSFGPKAAPVGSDIVYIGDSANNLNEAQTTISQFLVSYYSAATQFIGSPLGGIAGSNTLYSPTAAMGYLEFLAANNAGGYGVVVTNASFGQSSTLTIPDPLSSTASFLLNKGSSTLQSGACLYTDKGAGTEASNAVTINHQSGIITTSSLTTASAGTYTITLTNSLILGTSNIILCGLSQGTNTINAISVLAKCTAAGTAVIVISNNNASLALNGTILINFLIY